MKHWRMYHREIKNIFQADNIHYYVETETFEICSNSYVMEELYDLSMYCRDNRLWFYVGKNSDMDIVLVVYRI